MENVKIVITNLPSRKCIMRRFRCAYDGRLALYPPLELLYLHAIAKEIPRIKVDFIDAIAEKISIPAFLKRITKLNPELLVFLTGFETFPEELIVLAQLKKYLPHLRIVATGYLPTVFPDSTLKTQIVDIVLCNEPESTWKEFLQATIRNSNWNKLPGLAYHKNNQIFINAPRKRILNLDSLPFPSYEIIKIKKYKEFMFAKPIAAIQTSRGCPHHCIYCVKTYGLKYVRRSPENVVDEIEKHYQRHIRNIRFMDDNFTENSSHVHNICELILNRGLKIKWICLSRAQRLSRELLMIMHDAGCQRICVGIESGSEKMLSFYKKKQYLEEIHQSIANIRSAQIEAAGFFMVGGVEENDHDFMQTLQIARELKLDYAIAETVKIYPDTELARIYEKHNHIKMGLFDTGRLVHARARQWEKKFYYNFYLRPKYICQHFKQIIKNPLVSIIACYQSFIK